MNNLLVITQIITVLLVLYLAFFKGYFKEKGKNLATKEDIEVITKKVESVKTEFEVLTRTRIDLNFEKKSSYLSYYDKYFVWLNALMDTSFGKLDPFNGKQIDEYKAILNSMYMDLVNAEARMLLWNENLELVILANVLKVNTMTMLEPLVISALNNLKQIKQELMSLSQVIKTPSNKMFDNLIAIKAKHNDKIVLEYKELHQLIQQFIETSRKYLLTIK